MQYTWCPRCGGNLHYDCERDEYICTDCRNEFGGESSSLDLETRIVNLEQKMRDMGK